MNSSNDFNFNPYINSQGEHELQESVVAFIDVLGFKNRVQKAKEEGNSQEVFRDYHQTFLTWLSRENSDKFRLKGRKDTFVIRMFTDCILIGFPVRQEGHGNFIRGLDELCGIFSMLSLFQLDMLNSGYYVRGAVAVGEMYMSDDIIYGNATIDAYEAESNNAKFPRIILTESTENMLSEISASLVSQGNNNYINHYFNRDADGWLFLNYLESIKIGDSVYQFVNVLEEHQHQVKEKLVEYKNSPTLLEKYIWVANYHNYFCNQPPCYEDHIIDLTNYLMRVVQ